MAYTKQKFVNYQTPLNAAARTGVNRFAQAYVKADRYTTVIENFLKQL